MLIIPIVNYLRVIGCEPVAARGDEINEDYRIGHRNSKRSL